MAAALRLGPISDLDSLRALLGELFLDAPINIYIKDRDGRYLWVNKCFERTFGVDGSQLLGHTPAHLNERSLGEAQGHDAAVLELGRPVERVEQINGRTLRVLKCPIFDLCGHAAALIGFDVDVTDLERAQLQLEAQSKELRRLNAALQEQMVVERDSSAREIRIEKDRLRTTLESIADGVIAADAAGLINYVNPSAASITGWTPEDALGRYVGEIYCTCEEEHGEHTGRGARDPVAEFLQTGRKSSFSDSVILIDRHGGEQAVRESLSPVCDDSGRVCGVVLVFSNITEQRRLQLEMEHQATHDALTGLVNRQEFDRRLQRVMDRKRAQGSEHAVCFLDLDQFKVVNDSCGHLAGDELLREVAGIFSSNVRKRDTLARLGGDEFGILMEHCSSEQAERVARSVLDALSAYRFRWESQTFRVGVSIGLVPILGDIDGQTTESVLRAADQACYVAKDSSSDRLHVFRKDNLELYRHFGWLQSAKQLHDVLDNDRLRLYAQSISPIAAVDCGVCYEVLLRIEDDCGVILRPGTLLATAERYKLATEIDRWVVTTTFGTLAENPEHVAAMGFCSINLSGQSIGNEPIQQLIESLSRAHPQIARKVCFEITETAAISNLGGAVRFIHSLQAYGCRFALDDVGSGLASFSYIKSLPVDFLKIDGDFVSHMNDEPVDLAFIKIITEIARLTNKRSVAEGVESDTVHQNLMGMGVDFAQGFALGMPKPLAEFFSIRA